MDELSESGTLLRKPRAHWRALRGVYKIENLPRKPLDMFIWNDLLFCVGLTPREIAERKAELAKFRHDCREMVIKYSLQK